MVAPASQFCCGCSVSFGVKLLLIAHLMNNVYFCSSVAASIIGGGDVFVKYGHLHRMDLETASLAKNIAISGFCLAGIPIIFMALWGAFQRVETLVRLYFMYMLASVLLDLGFIIQSLVLEGPCDSLPSLVQGAGQAFSCGIARGVNVVFLAVLLGVQLYFIFIVWSFCEDIAENGAMDISDLGKDWQGKPLSKADMQRKLYQKRESFDTAEQDAMYGAIATSNEWKSYADGLFGGSEEQMYNYAATQGMGCKKIFNVSKHHEMRYPPPQFGSGP